MSQKKSTWTVVFHFGRGHVQTLSYDHKVDAMDAIRIAVFSNEDCINCSIYRQDTTVYEPASARMIVESM